MTTQTDKCTRCGKENPAEIHTCTAPLAIALAEQLEASWKYSTIAAELRRLHTENEALREALQAIVDDATPWGNQAANMAHIARAALARASEAIGEVK